MAKGDYIGVLTPQASLSAVSVGDTVKINENGVPVDYLVVQQGLPSSKYDSSCDGTWVLRKDCYQSPVAWDSDNVGNYENSDIHQYLNGTFLGLFDGNVQASIKQVKIPYTKGTSTAVSGANGLSAKAVLLCGQEINVTATDGSALKEDASVLAYFVNAGNAERIAYMDGKAQYWALRTPYPANTAYICRVRDIGDVQGYQSAYQYIIRPAFILPSNLSLTNGVVTGAQAELVSVARKVKKGYLGIDGIARKIKKAYIGIGGVAMPFFGNSVEDMVIAYNGNYTDQIVTMSNKRYRLLTLTSSGTLTVAEPVSAEVWVCGGGTSGHHSGYSTPGGGGAGAFTASGSVVLSGSTVAVIGAGGVSGTATATNAMFGAGGKTSFGSLATKTDFTRPYNNRSSGVSGGTGGGRCMNSTVSQIGLGDGVTKYPFGETFYFKPHCAGGGSGGYYNDGGYHGGAGGTNGGDGKDATYASGTGSKSGGSGGDYGGGNGGAVGSSGAPGTGGNASFYGSGGGGAGGRGGYTTVKTGGSGYQGVIYIRIPVA